MTEDGQDMRDAVLFALIRRSGGHVVIKAEEMPGGPFSFIRRWTEEGGVEMRVEIDPARAS